MSLELVKCSVAPEAAVTLTNILSSLSFDNSRSTYSCEQ